MASRLISSAVKPTIGLTKQVVRPFTVATQSYSTHTTTLANGLTVATEENPSSATATVGVWIGSGSSAEAKGVNGLANLAERVVLQGTKTRSGRVIESQLESIGGSLNAFTGREKTAFYAQSFKNDIPQVVDILSDIIQNPALDEKTIETQREAVIKQIEEEADPESIVFDHLHAIAYQGDSLGRPVRGIKESVEAITGGDIANYLKSNYSADRIVLVGSGNVDHEALVRLAEQKFGSLEVTPKVAIPKPSFIGSEIRVRDDTYPLANIALAVEGASWTSPDYYPLLVMKAIIGSWDRTLGAAANLSSRLSTIAQKHHLVHSFNSFTTSYNDTGLWGIYFETANKTQIDDFVHFLQEEWVRLSTSVTESEVERAKQQIKGSLLLGLDNNTTIADDIGTQVLTTGKRLSAEELSAAINKVTVGDVRRAANEYLWDKEVVVAGYGSVEGLTDYLRLRGNMSYNRF